MAIVTKEFVKEYLGITDTTYDAKITVLIPHVENDFKVIRGTDWHYDSNDEIEYPDNAETICAEMIAFKINSTGLDCGKFKDTQSESIGSHSQQRIEYYKGYPKHIVSGIERFHNAHK